VRSIRHAATPRLDRSVNLDFQQSALGRRRRAGRVSHRSTNARHTAEISRVTVESYSALPHGPVTAGAQAAQALTHGLTFLSPLGWAAARILLHSPCGQQRAVLTEIWFSDVSFFAGTGSRCVSPACVRSGANTN